ncbi:MAG TPA: DNA polymerase Y family protein [Candidatus Acidoferrales bacterium]|nr:DNA polymerase Y family protein [Candidatus Acidoferrales bacterium]
MAFASIYVPNFLVQAAMRAGSPQPSGSRGRALAACALALIEGTPPLWKVVAAGDAAVRAGVELGMTKLQALQFDGVEIRLRSPAQEKSAHAALLDLGWSFSPRIEDAAPDTIVVDLAGLAALFGNDENIAQLLCERAAALGFSVNVAISANIEAAIHASRGFFGITLIAAGEEARRLGPLPVAALGLSAETAGTLERWGIRDCAALAALPVLELSTRLGQEGVRLHLLARGASERSLVLAAPDFHFEEEMDLDDPVAELDPLAFLLNTLVLQLTLRLAARSLAICSLRLRFELEPSFEKGLQVGDDSSREKTAPVSWEKILALPVPTRNSAMLLNLLRLQLQTDPPPAPIQKILLAAEPARPRAAQSGLFQPASPDPERLELTLARLANLVGELNVGAPAIIDTHHPGEFRMERFAPPTEEKKSRRGKSAKNGKIAKRSSGGLPCAESPEAQIDPRAAIAFRAFRPAPPARVTLREDRPARVAFLGLHGEVVAASGPWRTSGDWWCEDGWKHDEWDLEIRFASAPNSNAANSMPERALYRFFYDSLRESWFVRGIYD